jgi:hypothetical protein
MIKINLIRKSILFLILYLINQNYIWPNSDYKETFNHFTQYGSKMILLKKFSGYRVLIIEQTKKKILLHFYDENLFLKKTLNYNSELINLIYSVNPIEISPSMLLIFGRGYDYDTGKQFGMNFVTINEKGGIISKNSYKGDLDYIQEYNGSYLFWGESYSVDFTKKGELLYGIISFKNDFKKGLLIKKIHQNVFFSHRKFNDLYYFHINNKMFYLTTHRDIFKLMADENNVKNFEKVESKINVYQSEISSADWIQVQQLSSDEIIRYINNSDILQQATILGHYFYIDKYYSDSSGNGFYTGYFVFSIKTVKKRRAKKVIYVTLNENFQGKIAGANIIPTDYGNQVIGVSGDYIYTVDNLPDNRVKIMKIKYSDFVKNLK